MVLQLPCVARVLQHVASGLDAQDLDLVVESLAPCEDESVRGNALQYSAVEVDFADNFTLDASRRDIPHTLTLRYLQRVSLD